MSWKTKVKKPPLELLWTRVYDKKLKQGLYKNKKALTSVTMKVPWERKKMAKRPYSQPKKRKDPKRTK